MSYTKKDRAAAVNAGSMADIAFLLLIFFLVTTTIASDKGIGMLLPPKDNEVVPQNERNVLNVLVNTNGELLVDNELKEFSELKETIKTFVDNNDVIKTLSVSPQKAVVSLKTDRGTSYERYIAVLDEIKLSYNELRAKHLGVSLDTYKSLRADDAEEKEKLDDARKAYPMQISDAEPFDASKLE